MVVFRLYFIDFVDNLRQGLINYYDYGSKYLLHNIILRHYRSQTIFCHSDFLTNTRNTRPRIVSKLSRLKNKILNLSVRIKNAKFGQTAHVKFKFNAKITKYKSGQHTRRLVHLLGLPTLHVEISPRHHFYVHFFGGYLLAIQRVSLDPKSSFRFSAYALYAPPRLNFTSRPTGLLYKIPTCDSQDRIWYKF